MLIKALHRLPFHTELQLLLLEKLYVDEVWVLLVLNAGLLQLLANVKTIEASYPLGHLFVLASWEK